MIRFQYHILAFSLVLSSATLIGCMNSVDTQEYEGDPRPSARVTTTAANSLSLLLGSTQSSSSVNLSNPFWNHNPILDWASWGSVAAPGYNHLAGVTARIATYATIPSGTSSFRTASPASPFVYSWTGGTPTASQGNVRSSVYTVGLNKGFRITCKSDGVKKVLRLMVGVERAKGRLRLFMSDGSSPAVTDESFTNSTGATFIQYAVEFSSTGSNVNLHADWTMVQDFGSGRVLLQAAVLDKRNEAPVNNIYGYNGGVTNSSEMNYLWSPSLRAEVRANTYDPDYFLTDVVYTQVNRRNDRPPAPYTLSDIGFNMGEAIRIYSDATDNYGATIRSNTMTLKSWVDFHFHQTPANIQIPDASPNGVMIPMEAPVPAIGRTGLTADMHLYLDIIHPFVGDLRVYLRNPAGQWQAVVLNRGGSSDNVQAHFGSSGQPVSQAASLSGGQAFIPEAPVSIHYNTPSQGTWLLQIIDDYSQDIGFYRGATLSLTAF